MSGLESTLRLTALPIAVCLATGVMYWIWKTYPHSQDFVLEVTLPFYALYLVLAAAAMGTVSGSVKQFLIITTFISFLFMIEIILRVMFDVFII